MRKYTFEVTVTEGRDKEFWEGIKGKGKKQILSILKGFFYYGGWYDTKVKLKKFEDK